MSYSDTKPAPKKRGRPKKVAPAPEPAPEPASAPAPSRPKGKMTDAQRTQLNKHMEKMKSGGMSASQMKSHRMSIMSRMRRGMSASKAHADLMGK